MICSKCKTNNSDNANYCRNCRAALSDNTMENLLKKIDECYKKLNDIKYYAHAATDNKIPVTNVIDNYARKNNVTGLTVGVVVFVFVFVFVLIFLISNDARETQIANMEKNMENRIAQIEQNMADYSPVPIIVKSLKIGNVDNNGNVQTKYGEKLYGSATMYFSPQIEYFGLCKTTITLNLKLYQDGVLRRDSQTSPDGYSYSCTDSFEVKEGVKILTGWGNSEKGHWSAGNYRYEIWYNGICLKAVDFKTH